MDEEKINNFVRSISEQMIHMGGALAQLRASVNVLKVYVASQMSPDDPSAALESLRQLEETLLANDQNEQERQEAAQIIDAVKEWRKMGKPRGSA